MGSSLLEPRRKRKRRLNMESSIKASSAPHNKRCAVSLPCVAVLFALAMAAIVGARKALKDSARRVATETRAGWARNDASAHPLAVLLLQQHEIESQAARFADPGRLCLSLGDGEPPSERLGLFTCLADTQFLLHALAQALGFSSVLTVDVGSNPLHPFGQTRGVGIGAGRESDVVPDALRLQARIEVGKDQLPDDADLVLVDAYSEALSEAAWEELIRSLVELLSERGVVVIRGPREGVALVTGTQNAEEGSGWPSTGWKGRINVWEAVASTACDSGSGVAAAVGDLDGCLIVLRHRAPGEAGLETGCRTEQNAEGVSGRGSAAVAVMAEPFPLSFERLFLWATAERDTSTERAIEGVRERFGGADALRRYARRRSDRSSCVNVARGGGQLEQSLTDRAGGIGSGDGHVRPKKRQILRGHASSNDVASHERYSAARVCLEGHLQEHPQDVRAGFALEMILRATGGKGVDKQVARLRARMSEETGAAGASLWRALHARTAGAVMTGLLI